jgi:UDP-N-acetylmuramate--alanine ligase
VATLEAARQYQAKNTAHSRIVALFQPHQPGRLRDLWEDFCAAFELADLVLIADIYIARGKAIDGISAESFVQAVKHQTAHHVPGSYAQLPANVLPYLQPGDLVLTIGAGDITKVGPQILDLLKQA